MYAPWAPPHFVAIILLLQFRIKLDASYLLKASQMTLSDCLFTYFQGFNRVLSRFGT